MALSRDQVELLIQLSGQEAVDKLARSTENYKGLIEELNRKFQQNEVTAEEYTQQLMQLARELERQRGLFDQLSGKPGGGGGGAGGQGILGASYAMQDFISVLSGGGGLGRALGSVSNNVPTLLMALGAGAGLTGVLSALFTLVSAGIPIMQNWWSAAADPEALEKAKKALEEFKQKAREAHEEFEKLKNAPTDYEKQSADLLKQFLQQRPNAEKASQGLMATMGQKSAIAAMDDKEREEYGRLGGDLLSDAEIGRVGDVAAMNASRSGQQVGPARQEAMDRARQARQRARDRRDALLKAARQRRADQLMQDALKPGPEGDAARGEIRKRALEEPEKFPGNFARHIDEMSPAALEEFDDRDRAEQDEHRDWHDRRAEGRKKRQQVEKRRERIERIERESEKAGESTPEELAQSAAMPGFDQAIRRSGAKLSDAEYWEGLRHATEARSRGVAGHGELGVNQVLKARRRLQKEAEETDREAQADRLLAHGQEIVGRAFGPAQAEMAGRANPAEVKEMRDRTIKNLEQGQAPYDALLNAFSEVREMRDRTIKNLEQGQAPYGVLLDAFREVNEASAGNARRTQQFFGQFNAMRGRVQTTTQPATDASSY